MQNRIGASKKKEPTSFEKKKQVQVVDEDSSKTIEQQPEASSNQQTQRKRPAPDQQRIDVEQILSNPLFYKNLLKHNTKLVNELSTEVHRELFETNREYMKKLAETYMSTHMRKEIMDFKISFADFLKDFLQRQLNVSMQSADVEALRREVEALKSNSIAVNASINEDKSVMLDQQLKEVKGEVGALKEAIEEIKANQERLDGKLDATLGNATKNPESPPRDDDHQVVLQKAKEQEAAIESLKTELKANQDKITALEGQVDFKLAALEQIVQRQKLDYSVSVTQLHDEANNFFNKEEMSFSIIKAKKEQNDETQMLEVKELNNYMGAGLIQRHSDFIAPDKPDNPTSPKQLAPSFDDYTTQHKGFGMKEVGTNEDMAGPAERYSFLDSENYPRRTTNSPYTPDIITKQSTEEGRTEPKRLKVRKEDLEHSLVDVSFNNNMANDIQVDEHGFVVDHNGFPILDANGNLIKLNEDNIQNLKNSKASE